ncbi:MAG: flagellar basal body P-ring protein FlgI, partial [Rhodomicrobium sp.]
ETALQQRTAVKASESGGSLNMLDGDNLQTLVTGLNRMGLKPQGIIAILQAIKSAGALQGELVVQ